MNVNGIYNAFAVAAAVSAIFAREPSKPLNKQIYCTFIRNFNGLAFTVKNGYASDFCRFKLIIIFFKYYPRTTICLKSVDPGL